MLRLAILATLAVPAVIYLAGDAVASPPSWWERAGLGLAAGSGVLLLACFRVGSRGVRLLLAALALLAASPFLLGRFVDHGYEAEDRAFRRMDPEALAAAPGLLLVTADVAGAAAHRFPPERWVVPEGVLAASPRRDSALASLLTGEPVIQHRVLFDGDQVDPGARSLGTALSLAGFETRIHGGQGLPRWASRGLDSAAGGVVEAGRWIAARQGAPRFAHVHVDRVDPAAIDAATRDLAPDEVLVVVVSLTGAPEPDGVAGTFLDPASLRVLLALRVGPDAFEALEERPRSVCEAHESIVRAIEQDRAPMRPLASAERTALGDRVADSEVVVVSLAHGQDDLPHRIRAVFSGAVLDVSATPLGEHPTDDWALVGPTASHPAYRNVVRVTPAERASDRDALVERLARWRREHGWREWRREDPGTR